MTLGWAAATDDTAGSGIGGYEVWAQGGVAPLLTTSARTATITGLPANSDATFLVRAYDVQGNVGPYSNAVTVRTEPAPSAPSSVSASSSCATPSRHAA